MLRARFGSEVLPNEFRVEETGLSGLRGRAERKNSRAAHVECLLHLVPIQRGGYGHSIELVNWDLPWSNLYDMSIFGDRPMMPGGATKKELYDYLFAGVGGRGFGDEGWYGFLPYSVDHIIKLSGTYFAPYGAYVSANIEYLSGYHWDKKGLSNLGPYLLFPEGRGGRTTPPHMYVDLALEKDFRLRQGLVLGLGVNAYNILNSQRPVSFVQEDNSLFGQVWARRLPRWTQIKAILKF